MSSQSQLLALNQAADTGEARCLGWPRSARLDCRPSRFGQPTLLGIARRGRPGLRGREGGMQGRIARLTAANQRVCRRARGVCARGGVCLGDGWRRKSLVSSLHERHYQVTVTVTVELLLLPFESRSAEERAARARHGAGPTKLPKFPGCAFRSSSPGRWNNASRRSI